MTGAIGAVSACAARPRVPRNAPLAGSSGRTGALRHYRSSLGYEPYDACLSRLAWSLVAALTSVNGHGASMPNLGVSRVAPYPTASRAQIRAQIWLLARGIAVPTIASVSGCRRSGSGIGFGAVTWAYASCALLGLPCMSCIYPRGPWRSRAVVGLALGPWILLRLHSCGPSAYRTRVRATAAADGRYSEPAD